MTETVNDNVDRALAYVDVLLPLISEQRPGGAAKLRAAADLVRGARTIERPLAICEIANAVDAALSGSEDADEWQDAGPFETSRILLTGCSRIVHECSELYHGMSGTNVSNLDHAVRWLRTEMAARRHHYSKMSPAMAAYQPRVFAAFDRADSDQS